MTHYFDERPDVASDMTVVDVALPDVAFTMTTDRGVFSHGHLDTGTSLLLREAPPPPPVGMLLDLGCGAGAIALTLALRAPAATVWAIDVNARALALTESNAARNGIVNIAASSPDQLPDDVRFDLIWSNPPIRIGKQALHELLERWLGRLTPDGDGDFRRAEASRGRLAPELAAVSGFPAERVASRAGYRLLRVGASAA